MRNLPAYPLVMGIINVTPDSFSGDGVLDRQDYAERAVDQAARMMRDGAAVLDIGGESTRPGSSAVSLDEELRRVIPVVVALRAKLPAAILSIDTAKAEVARQSLAAGADIINDVTALEHDPQMADVVAKSGSSVVLMHNRSKAAAVTSGGAFVEPLYENVVKDVRLYLQGRAAFAIQAGITSDRIILDPGIGFGKSVQQNMALIANLHEIKALGFPVLMGVSRKSFIGLTLNCPADDRLEGTAACVTACILQGADIVRVHDVKFMARTAMMATALRDA